MAYRVGRLKQIDGEKRATLKKLAAGAAFAAPVVLSFSVGNLAVTDVRAYVNPGDSAEVALPGQGENMIRRSDGKPVNPFGQD